MSVVVKGMRMPENCEKCMMRDGLYCMASDYKRISYGAMHRREEWCPLVDLGKHGDLIDADELAETAEYYETVMDLRHRAKVVIEAEEE